MNAIKRNIPNIITLTNLFCGLCAIIFAFGGNLILSGGFILIGAFLDFLDGLSARILNAYSEFGKQLDSFADMITFGVAPSMILFKLFVLGKEKIYFGDHLFETPTETFLLSPIILCLLTPICSAIRLAKFNINNKHNTYFIGLPTPALGIFIAALAIEYERIPMFSNDQFLLITSILLPILLISNIQFFSLKFNKKESFRSRVNTFKIILIISSIILFFFFWFAAIPFIVVLYLSLSLLNNIL